MLGSPKSRLTEPIHGAVYPCAERPSLHPAVDCLFALTFDETPASDVQGPPRRPNRLWIAKGNRATRLRIGFCAAPVSKPDRSDPATSGATWQRSSGIVNAKCAGALKAASERARLLSRTRGSKASIAPRVAFSVLAATPTDDVLGDLNEQSGAGRRGVASPRIQRPADSAGWRLTLSAGWHKRYSWATKN